MSPKRTPFYELHCKLGAKIVEFGGWEMPLQYTSILEEHRAVREDVGVFDVSHMGRIEIRGEQALDLVQLLITNDAAMLKVNRALYSPMCNPQGGVIDDILVYRLPASFLLVVNAATKEKDLNWIERQATRFPKAEVKDVSETYAQIALQGPRAEETLRKLADLEADLPGLAYYHAVEAEYAGEEVLISRTGYTGEDGFEVYGAPEAVLKLWNELIESGVQPVGLGARDSLRFEASYPLYGHELDEETTPIEAGLGWTVKDKPMDYMGKEVLIKQKHGEGIRKRLVGFKMLEGGVPRQGYKLFLDGEEAGYVTSGMKAPTLGEFLGMGYLRVSEPPDVGTEVKVEIRGELKRAEIVKLPFYRGSIKR